MEKADGLLPVMGKERIIALDVIRAIALLGILLVNMQLFNSPVQYITELETPWWENPWDRAADYLITILAEGKFYPMFTFLFGFGFYIFMERADQKERPVVSLYLRRTFLLLVFGILHITLLWWGDILHFYATVGVFLLFFRRMSPGKLLVWAIVMLVLPVLIVVLLISLTVTAGSGETVSAAEYGKSFARYANQMLESSLTVYAGGGFGEIYQQRIADFAFAVRNSYLVAPQVLAIFLLGMYAARQRLVQNSAKHRYLLKRLWAGCLVPGVFFVWLQVAGKYRLSSGFLLDAELLYFVGAVVGGTTMGLFYITSILLLLQRETWYRKLSPLAPVGRLALTNYILQSIICTTIFYGYGFGLYGRVSPVWGIVMTVLIFVGQFVFSCLWFKHFLFGPLEWIWRTLTYGKMQPNKRRMVPD